MLFTIPFINYFDVMVWYLIASCNIFMELISYVPCPKQFANRDDGIGNLFYSEWCLNNCARKLYCLEGMSSRQGTNSWK